MVEAAVDPAGDPHDDHVVDRDRRPAPVPPPGRPPAVPMPASEAMISRWPSASSVHDAVAQWHGREVRAPSEGGEAR